MNVATRIVRERALFEYEGLSFGEDDYEVTAAEIRDYCLRLAEDYPEDYDCDYYPLVVTSAIETTIVWESIASAITEWRRKVLDEEAAAQ
jgi:hypothetical protein